MGNGITQALAAKWIEREQALGLKGKAADTAVYEYFTGAAAALELAGHPSASHLATCVVAVLRAVPFPCATVRRWAAGAPGSA